MKINFRVGDTIVVSEKIKENDKIRLHDFEGVVIAIRGSDINQSFTIRKIGAGNIGVERIWPINCPSIEKIIVKKKGQVKKAKLYYLRKRIGKQALLIKDNKNQPSEKINVKELPKINLEKVIKSTNDQTKSQ